MKLNQILKEMSEKYQCNRREYSDSSPLNERAYSLIKTLTRTHISLHKKIKK